MNKCIVEDCKNTKIIAKKMCWKHYRRMLRHNTLETKSIMGNKECIKCGTKNPPFAKRMCHKCYCQEWRIQHDLIPIE